MHDIGRSDVLADAFGEGCMVLEAIASVEGTFGRLYGSRNGGTVGTGFEFDGGGLGAGAV